MNLFRKINKQTPLLGSLLLSLALLCAQSVILHTHSLNQQPYADHHSKHLTDQLKLDHKILSQAHLAYDNSHEHHDGISSEVNITPDGLLKNTNNILVIALFAFFVSLIVFSYAQQPIRYLRENKLTLHRLNILSPPLRGPPTL